MEDKKMKLRFVLLTVILSVLTLHLFADDDIVQVLMRTTMGSMVLELDRSTAPNTVDNFVGLATGTKEFRDPVTGVWVTRHFYDNLLFHRVINNFMIQGGCPLGTGTGGPGYQFPCETSPDDNVLYGHIAMANAGPNTNGSQFFIVTRQPGTPHLNGNHTIFGRVTHGMDVANAIQRVPTNANDRPLTDVRMITVRVIEEIAEFDVTPDLIDFGNVRVGSISNERSISITNTGNVPIIINNVIITGPHVNDFRITTDVELYIFPGDEDIVAVVFSPLSSGSKHATIEIVNNTPGINHRTPLTGGGVVSDDDTISDVLTTGLLGNFPNPFNPNTTIEFGIRNSKFGSNFINIGIYNIRGQRVRTLINEEMVAGFHSVEWNGKDDSGRVAGSGIYFYRMTTKEYTTTRKMLLMK